MYDLTQRPALAALPFHVLAILRHGWRRFSRAAVDMDFFPGIATGCA
jgi:hypothetical protein